MVIWLFLINQVIWNIMQQELHTEHLYSYDTHVPLIFYGWHVKKGESYDKKVITQIAPTLSQMLKITFPNGTEAKF